MWSSQYPLCQAGMPSCESVSLSRLAWVLYESLQSQAGCRYLESLWLHMVFLPKLNSVPSHCNDSLGVLPCSV